MEKKDNIDSKNVEISNELLFKDFNHVSKEDTLDEIIKYNKSISRFGDGEFVLMTGKGISFQEYDKNLSQRLLEIIKDNNESNLLVGINLIYNRKEINLYIDSVAKFWINFFKYYKIKCTCMIESLLRFSIIFFKNY